MSEPPRVYPRNVRLWCGLWLWWWHRWKELWKLGVPHWQVEVWGRALCTSWWCVRWAGKVPRCIRWKMYWHFSPIFCKIFHWSVTTRAIFWHVLQIVSLITSPVLDCSNGSVIKTTSASLAQISAMEFLIAKTNLMNCIAQRCLAWGVLSNVPTLANVFDLWVPFAVNWFLSN